VVGAEPPLYMRPQAQMSCRRAGHWQPRTPVASAWWRVSPARYAQSLRLGAERASTSARLPIDGDEAIQTQHIPPGSARALGPRSDGARLPQLAAERRDDLAFSGAPLRG